MPRFSTDNSQKSGVYYRTAFLLRGGRGAGVGWLGEFRSRLSKGKREEVGGDKFTHPTYRYTLLLSSNILALTLEAPVYLGAHVYPTILSNKIANCVAAVCA